MFAGPKFQLGNILTIKYRSSETVMESQDLFNATNEEWY